jgi:hypothetical protein
MTDTNINQDKKGTKKANTCRDCQIVNISCTALENFHIFLGPMIPVFNLHKLQNGYTLYHFILNGNISVTQNAERFNTCYKVCVFQLFWHTNNSAIIFPVNLQRLGTPVLTYQDRKCYHVSSFTWPIDVQEGKPVNISLQQ